MKTRKTRLEAREAGLSGPSDSRFDRARSIEPAIKAVEVEPGAAEHGVGSVVSRLEPVIARIAVQDVSAVPAHEPVVPGTTGDAIVIGTTEDPVAARAAEQPIGSDASLKKIAS